MRRWREDWREWTAGLREAILERDGNEITFGIRVPAINEVIVGLAGLERNYGAVVFEMKKVGCR